MVLDQITNQRSVLDDLNLDMIQSMWEEDSNRCNHLHEESLKVPQLHSNPR